MDFINLVGSDVHLQKLTIKVQSKVAPFEMSLVEMSSTEIRISTPANNPTETETLFGFEGSAHPVTEIASGQKNFGPRRRTERSGRNFQLDPLFRYGPIFNPFSGRLDN